MKTSKVLTASVCGLDVELVSVETDLSQGLPGLTLVGLPNPTVRESKERIRSAITNSGLRFPQQRITVNLFPADTRKEGSHFDLPLAVSVIAAAEQFDDSALASSAFIGELSLDGTLHRTEPATALLLGIREQGIKKVFLPEENLEDASEIDDMECYPANRLEEVVDHLSGKFRIDPVATRLETGGAGRSALRSDFGDYSEVKGQERAKRALQICAAGGHGLAMYGPPGTGKSMLASRIPTILPALDKNEIREVAKLYSIAGESSRSNRPADERPFRAPHHSVTAAAMVGGGRQPKPGELTLAHRGVLFLDELPEFDRRTLDMLRQPLEDEYIDLSRVGYRSRYPCRFILIVAMNPCPCGYYGDPGHVCNCDETRRRRYLSKVSGPFLDRIDMHVQVSGVEYSELRGGESASSEELSEGVLLAREMQRRRSGAEGDESSGAGDVCNARLTPEQTERICRLSGKSETLFRKAYGVYGFSARQGRKMLRLARTIADIEGSEIIETEHVSEAVSYRRPAEMSGGCDG
ncbi:MAG: YifB family Mg chelatase-like AAA ATPase [Clostridiales Family XIII bacterium]|jgi:magnesium chelatase family protein|nr:YifB family Mg chelatase-like AAA ATPase [Clostridiales Family XIII bacterium]